MARKPPLYPHMPKRGLIEGVYRRYPHAGGKIAPPGSELPRERDTREAIELARQAISHLERAWHMSDFDAALWRLVDAAGLVGQYANVTAIGQVKSPTGRGYFLGVKRR